MPKYLIANFNRYHPKAHEVTSSQRNGNGKLKWIRLDTDWDHDSTIAVLPWGQRALWPWLLARAGKGSPVGTFDLSSSQISQLTSLSVPEVKRVLRHLKRCGVVRSCDGSEE